MAARPRLVLGVSVAAALAVSGVAGAEETKLRGTVGPGFTISLDPRTGVQPGQAELEVEDRSDEHNFHLTGPGVDVATEVEGTGSTKFALTLVDGTYSFVCDVHASMRGTLSVGAGGTTPPPPPVTKPKPKPKPSYSAPKGAKLVLTSGPGFTIGLKTKAGKRVTRLAPGAYTVLVRDRSAIHNARLRGAGVNRATAVGARATQTWKVRLKRGTLVFQCDPHRSTMRGTVRIG